jgi:hypothetical protein
MSDHPDNAPSPARDVELSDLDLRYQGHRLLQPRLEERLLSAWCAITKKPRRAPRRGFISL